MSLLVAVLTASLFAVFGLPYQHYQCWFSFSRIGTIAGTLLYFLLAGGGGGAVGWAVATLAKADPTGNPVLNGVLYGIAGALAMRADFAAGPRPDTRRLSPTGAGDQLAGARSALTLGIKWTTTLLDVHAARRAEAWLITLTDAELSQEALRVQADITGQPSTVVSDTIKKRLSAMLVGEMEHLNEDNARIRFAARAQLIGFCTRYYTERHLAKTPHRRAARRTPRTPPGTRTERARGEQTKRTT